jgi:hypothetical protein
MLDILWAAAVAAVLLIITTVFAFPSTSCTTRKSGSVVITSCSDSGHRPNYTQCRSYRSGSVVKTSCR